MSEEKTVFTAVFVSYERLEDSIFDQISHYKDVRTRDGCVVKNSLFLPPEITKKIVGHLTRGEYISFLANVEFSNIEFQYPHALLDELMQ